MTETKHTPKPLKWGIMGASRIARRRFVDALREAGEEVVAVAASSAERAKEFADVKNIAKSYGSYEALLDDPQVEAVYLALSNDLHLEWAVRSARAGKSCLCEKPLVLSAADARELHNVFAESRGRLLEAFMWRHHPQTHWLAEQVAAGELGRLQKIHTTFSFTLELPPENYRWHPDKGGGSLFDLGSYGVNAARYFFGCEPTAASARAQFLPEPRAIDESVSAWMDFGEGRLATISCSYRTTYFQCLELLGTEGRAWLTRPWTNLDQTTQIEIERNGERMLKRFAPENSYALMITHFRRAVRDPAFALRPGEDGAAQALAMEGLMISARNQGKVWTP